jgi:glycosyltransferase involved in cell wall biosynthesis
MVVKIDSGSKDLISLLIPTRHRPNNVKKVIRSALTTADEPTKIEFLFYVDNDDTTFPKSAINEQVKVIKGPRVWISLISNILYANSNGEIIMYGGDDMVFRSKGWDTAIRNEFNKIPDKICLVYTNDGVKQSQDIARHGFIHRKWFSVLGSAFPSGRVVPIDLWCTDIAKQLNRIRYIEEIVIEHVHYRQGGLAKLDPTYIDAANTSKSWRALEVYRKLGSERRADRVLLSEVMIPKPKWEIKYLLGEFIAAHKKTLKLDSLDSRRLRSLDNFRVIISIINKLIKNN